jgi:hypothetical protein
MRVVAGEEQAILADEVENVGDVGLVGLPHAGRLHHVPVGVDDPELAGRHGAGLLGLTCVPR